MIRKLCSGLLALALVVALAPQASATNRPVNLPLDINHVRYIVSSGDLVTSIADAGSWSSWSSPTYYSSFGCYSVGNMSSPDTYTGGATSSNLCVYNTYSEYHANGNTYDVLIPEGASAHFDYSESSWGYLGVKNNTLSPSAYVTKNSSFWLRLWSYNPDTGNFHSEYTSSVQKISTGSTFSLDIPSVNADIVRVDLILAKKFSLADFRSGSLRPCLASTYSLAYDFSGISNQLSDIQNTNKGILGKLGSLFDFVLTIPHLIIDGIKGLFVPSADDLSGISDDFEGVLAQKLGAVWQVGDFILSTLSGISSAGTSGTVSFPGITLNLVGTTFSIPSAEVEIFPEALGVLRDAVRLLVTSVFLGAWLFGMQRFLDKILDGGDSE